MLSMGCLSEVSVGSRCERGGPVFPKRSSGQGRSLSSDRRWPLNRRAATSASSCSAGFGSPSTAMRSRGMCGRVVAPPSWCNFWRLPTGIASRATRWSRRCGPTSRSRPAPRTCARPPITPGRRWPARRLSSSAAGRSPCFRRGRSRPMPATSRLGAARHWLAAMRRPVPPPRLPMPASCSRRLCMRSGPRRRASVCDHGMWSCFAPAGQGSGWSRSRRPTSRRTGS